MKMQRPSWPNVRNGILFFSGLAGVTYETVFRRPPDYGILPVFAAMLGLPAFIKPGSDREKSRPKNGDGYGEETEWDSPESRGGRRKPR